MSWFRVYTDILYNRKLNNVSDGAFRLFFELLALWKDGQIKDGITPDELARTLRRDRRKVRRTFNELLDNFLITSIGLPSKLSERQFLQSESAERVAKHRAQQKTVTVTPLRVRAESETEGKRKRPPSRSKKSWADGLLKKHGLPPEEDMSAERADEIIDDLKDRPVHRSPARIPEAPDPDLTPEERAKSLRTLQEVKEAAGK